MMYHPLLYAMNSRIFLLHQDIQPTAKRLLKEFETILHKQTPENVDALTEYLEGAVRAANRAARPPRHRKQPNDRQPN